MDKPKFLTMMDEILELSPGTIRGEEHLADLEDWDSLTLISFMAKVNMNYGKILSPQLIAQCETVDDLLKLTADSPA